MLSLEHHYFERENSTVSTQDITTDLETTIDNRHPQTLNNSKFDHETNVGKENAGNMYKIIRTQETMRTGLYKDLIPGNVEQFACPR